MLYETVIRNPWIPHVPWIPQAELLTLDASDASSPIDPIEALYGGAAGGGKSDGLLMALLQYVEVPQYAGMAFRRTHTDLALPGALIPRSHEWLAGTAAQWHDRGKRWMFPSGATVTFAYIDHAYDHLRYQGAELQTVVFDELTQFPSMDQYTYLYSRTRRLAGSEVPIRILSASNPGDQGHDWVSARWGLGAYETIGPHDRGTRIFIPAKLDDNPSLDRESYIASLQHLDPVSRERLLNGDWSVVDPGEVFRREWFHMINADELPSALQEMRYWDRAATAPKKGTDPDWTAGPRGGVYRGNFYITSMVRFRGTPGENERRIVRAAEEDGTHVRVRMEQEPGSSGVDTIAHYRGALIGYDFGGDRPTGPKEERAGLWAGQAEAGNVYVVRAGWNGDFFDECDAFPYGKKDQVDAVSGLFKMLTTGMRGDPRIN